MEASRDCKSYKWSPKKKRKNDLKEKIAKIAEVQLSVPNFNGSDYGSLAKGKSISQLQYLTLAWALGE